jgi:hypothetical protein
MRLRRVLTWVLALILVVGIAGFVAFLYFIPPFTLTPPEEFINAEAAAAPDVSGIEDPATRALAERGRYLVVSTGCAGCHVTPGPQGPQWDMYLAGGFKSIGPDGLEVVSRNLTPDRETGIGQRTDEEIKRVLRSGIMANGRPIYHRAMPWSAFSHWTDDDLHAVVVFLRHVKPVRHEIPDPAPVKLSDPEAIEEAYGGKDYGRPVRQQ